MREDSGFEGALQKSFDRSLSRLPVLLVLIGHDLTKLIIHRNQLPGAEDTTPLLAVTRSGAATSGISVLGPDELLAAWGSSAYT